MQISIEFDSIWQNSFLDGSDDSPIGKDNKREFTATSQNKVIARKEITKSTVLGILSRLIGDQRKLYQARGSDNYYFKDKEDLIDFEIDKSKIWEEMAFIVNKSNNRPPQSVYLGVIKDDEKLFFSETAPLLWSILYMDIDDILVFIINDKVCNTRGDSKPDNLLKKIEAIQNLDSLILIKDEVSNIEAAIEKEKEKFLKKDQVYQEISSPTVSQKKAKMVANENMEKYEIESRKGIEAILNSDERNAFDEKLQKVLEILLKQYPDQIYLDKAKVIPMRLYAVALYIQAERMFANGLDIEYCLNKEIIQIQGFSKRAFNGVRDFLNKLAGSHKKTVGTPYPLTKASGTLEITLDISRDKAKELKQLIENAGVSSFYLGKKGLAYVTNIDTREVS